LEFLLYYPAKTHIYTNGNLYISIERERDVHLHTHCLRDDIYKLLMLVTCQATYQAMAGLVLREVRRSFKQGVVCGYVSKSDHSLHLNPGEQQKLEWGDRLIVLANDGELETPNCWSSYALHVQ